MINKKLEINLKSEKAITLIALVITIIVLLILAGVSISMLSGDNSILNRATTARENTGTAQIDEKVKIANASAITIGQGTIDYDVLVEELEKQLGQQGESNWTISAKDTKPWIVTAGGNTYEISGTAKKEALTEQEDGTFIDSDNNEWVFIEVPKSVTASATTENEIYGALRDYCKDVISVGTSSDSYTTTTRGYKDEWYAWDNNAIVTEATASEKQKKLTNGCGLNLDDYKKLKKEMLYSIKENGGFYIGKYETGISGTKENTTAARTSSGEASQKAVIQADFQPYNWVTCSQAQNLAKGLAPEGKTTSLLFGIQWDLVLKFIKVKENISENTILTSNSTTWGNYSNNNSTNGTFNITSEHAMASSDYGASFSAITKGTEKSGTKLLTTGSSTGLAKQNIYDFAGNVNEWTLEQTSDSSYSCALRGGDCFSHGGYGPASYRSSYNPTFSDGSVGFRVALY